MTGQVVSLFGDFFALFAVMEWLAFRRHAGASAVTMVTFWALLPTAVFSPVAGALVDRWDAKKTLIASDIGRAALIAVLLWANSLTAIYAVFVGLGLWSSVFQPARAVLIKTLVADEELIAANGMLQQALLLVRIVAMPIGALLTASLGTRACYLADIASFMVSAAAILSIRRVHRPRDKRPGQAALRSEIGEGLRFLLGRPALCRIIVCLGIALFIATAMTPLLAIYVRDRAPQGSMYYSILNAMVAAGAVSGISRIPRLRRTRRDSRLVFLGLAVLAWNALAIGIIRNTPLVAASAFGIGVGVSLVLTPAQTMLQIHSPMDMMGRITSSALSLLAFAQMAGIAVSGGFAQTFGVRVVFAGCAALAGVTAALLRLGGSGSVEAAPSPAKVSIGWPQAQNREEAG